MLCLLPHADPKSRAQAKPRCNLRHQPPCHLGLVGVRMRPCQLRPSSPAPVPTPKRMRLTAPSGHPRPPILAAILRTSQRRPAAMAHSRPLVRREARLGGFRASSGGLSSTSRCRAPGFGDQGRRRPRVFRLSPRMRFECLGLPLIGTPSSLRAFSAGLTTQRRCAGRGDGRPGRAGNKNRGRRTAGCAHMMDGRVVFD